MSIPQLLFTLLYLRIIYIALHFQASIFLFLSYFFLQNSLFFYCATTYLYDSIDAFEYYHTIFFCYFNFNNLLIMTQPLLSCAFTMICSMCACVVYRYISDLEETFNKCILYFIFSISNVNLRVRLRKVYSKFQWPSYIRFLLF